LPERIASNTFVILLIIRILQFNTVSTITCCLRKLIIIIATVAVLPFARLTFQFLVQNLKRARWVYIFRRQRPIVYAAETYLRSPAPIFQKFGSVWVYYFLSTPFGNPAMPKRQQTNLLQRTSFRSRTST